ncbi:MAG TPA: DUF5009 domain-containing protein [Planctomycetaceae bacterium]|nr:DUF5009 domain-containing protein [Planctomycetaceae bacterium]
MATPAVSPAAPRLASIDVYRGAVMFLMMAEVLGTAEVARALPNSSFWHWVAAAQTHVEWVGCSLHDLIQPSFSFLVGVALPFSIASRRARGQANTGIFAHAVWRAALLIFLGIFLRSMGRPQTNWTFEDTLTQIGLGYPWLVLLGFRSTRFVWGAFVTILITYWAAWALYPLPAANFDYTTVGVTSDWPYHAHGFAAHWNKNANLGAAFDQWFLNMFSRPSPFVANSGGYLTLNFIPTLGTMCLGLLAGDWLRAPLSESHRVRLMVSVGCAAMAIGLALHWLEICPVVKRIWTPSWTLFSGGCCFVLLAAFHTTVDVKGRGGWMFPLRVVGLNSIAAYCMAHLLEGFVDQSLRTHFGSHVFAFAGATFAPVVRGLILLAIFWLILLWMYRRKLFLKI